MTFAALKRSITPGTVLSLTHHGTYGPGDAMPWGRPGGTITLPLTRPVARVQSNAVTFRMDDGRESWLYWPKASEVTVRDDGSFSLRGMTYRIEQ